MAGAAVAAGVEGEVFTEAEHEVAAILCDLADLVRARSQRRRRRRRRERRKEIPSWGCRRPRTVLPAAVEKPAASADMGCEVAASPDTPLVFHPDESSGGDDGDEAFPPPAATKKMPASHAEWMQQQRGVVASLSEENAHLSMQIEEYRIRLQSLRSTNDDLKQMQGKLKRQREQEEEEERKGKLQATATAIDRPAPVLGLDLNEPARAPEEDGDEAAANAAAAAAAEWYHLGQQRAAMTAAARHRRQEIRRAKAAAGRMRRIVES